MVSNSLSDFNRFFVYKNNKEIIVDLRFYDKKPIFISKEKISNKEKLEILKIREEISKI